MKWKYKNYFYNVKYFPIILLVFSEVLSFSLPFYIWTIFPNLPSKLNISEGQFLEMTLFFEFVVLILQIPGGILSEKYNCKKMIIIALIILGFILLFWDLALFWNGNDYNQDGKNDSFLYLFYLYSIYIFWAFSGSLLLWTQLRNLISEQGDSYNQAKIYGFSQSINALLGFFFIYLFAFLINFVDIFVNEFDLGLYLYFFVISILLFISTIIVFFFVTDNNYLRKGYIRKGSALSKILKNYKIWLLGFSLMGFLILRDSLFFMSSYFANSLVFKPFVIWILLFISLYFLAGLFGFFSGDIADKSRSYIELMVWVIGLSALCFLGIIILPRFGNNFTELDRNYQITAKIIIFYLYVIMSIFVWAGNSFKYVQIMEIDTPPNSYPLVISVISTIAFSEKLFLNPLFIIVSHHYILDDGSGNTSQLGNQIMLLIMFIFVLIAFFAALLLWKINNYEYKKYNLTSYRKGLSNTMTINRKVNIFM